MKLAGITMLLAGEIILVSDDLGVALCYVFIFIIMAYVGGVTSCGSLPVSARSRSRPRSSGAACETTSATGF